MTAKWVRFICYQVNSTSVRGKELPHQTQSLRCIYRQLSANSFGMKELSGNPHRPFCFTTKQQVKSFETSRTTTDNITERIKVSHGTVTLETPNKNFTIDLKIIRITKSEVWNLRNKLAY